MRILNPVHVSLHDKEPLDAPLTEKRVQKYLDKMNRGLDKFEEYLSNLMVNVNLASARHVPTVRVKKEERWELADGAAKHHTTIVFDDDKGTDKESIPVPALSKPIKMTKKEANDATKCLNKAQEWHDHLKELILFKQRIMGSRAVRDITPKSDLSYLERTINRTKKNLTQADFFLKSVFDGKVPQAFKDVVEDTGAALDEEYEYDTRTDYKVVTISPTHMGFIYYFELKGFTKAGYSMDTVVVSLKMDVHMKTGSLGDVGVVVGGQRHHPNRLAPQESFSLENKDDMIEYIMFDMDGLLDKRMASPTLNKKDFPLAAWKREKWITNVDVLPADPNDLKKPSRIKFNLNRDRDPVQAIAWIASRVRLAAHKRYPNYSVMYNHDSKNRSVSFYLLPRVGRESEDRVFKFINKLADAHNMDEDAKLRIMDAMRAELPYTPMMKAKRRVKRPGPKKTTRPVKRNVTLVDDIKERDKRRVKKDPGREYVSKFF